MSSKKPDQKTDPHVRKIGRLFHPAVQDITVAGILHAFCDPVRVQIFMDIARAECPKTCSTYLSVKGRKIAKSTLSQHFKILREAGLIHSQRAGVELHNTTRCAELKKRFGPMIGEIINAYIEQDKSKKRKKS